MSDSEASNEAESEVGDSQNLTGFNTDSLGRMSDSEASNEATSRETPLEQTPVTDIQIWSICDEVGEDWRDLGTVLGIASSLMDNIEADNRSWRDRAGKLLRKWITKEGKGATVGILIDALEKIERIDVIEKLLEMNRCLQCPNLEREINNLKTQRETFMNKISQLEGMHAEDEQRRENSKKKDEIIKKKNTKIADLEKTNKIQVNHIDDLTRTNEKIKTEKSNLVEEKEKMKKQIEELKAEKDEQKSKLQVQMEKQIGDLKAEKEELRLKLQAKTDQEELDQLKTQVGDLSSQIEDLNRKGKSSESECKRLQEELRKYKNPANLAESEAGSNQNLTGFKADSLGRMDDSEASNKGTADPLVRGTMIRPGRASLNRTKANLAESNAGNNQNLTGFNTDSLGRMDDSEASNEDTSYNIQHEQTLVTPIQVTSICGDVGDDWKYLAARLGLSFADISNIDADGRESREKAYKVIEKWFKREGIEATVGRLINALEEIERKDAAQKLLTSGEEEVGLNRARVQSGMIRKDFEHLVVDVQSGQRTIRKELQELKKIVHAVIPTAKGEKERENIETWVERLEAVCKRLEKCLSDLYTEESVKEGPEQDTISVGKSSDQMSAALCDLVKNLKMIYESWREFAEISLKRKNTLWSDKNDRPLCIRQGKDGMADRSQKDTEQICKEQRKCEEATIEVLYEANLAESNAGNNQNLTEFNTDSLGRMDDSEANNRGNQLCGRCLNLEEDPNDIKEDSDRLMKDISRLESVHSKEKEEWKDTMVEVIKEKDMNISILENKNDKLLVEIGELQRKIEETETQKETVLKEHKKMEEKIEKLGTMNEELKSEKCELSTQRDRLMKDIGRLESVHSNEKGEWKGTMDKVIKEKDMNISILENKNEKLLVEIGKLQRKIEEIETQKETVLKEHKKMEEQIEKLGTMNKELKNLNFRNHQRDTMKKDQASQRRRGVKVQQRYDEVDRCLRCPNLEKELKDLKAERDTLKNKISQLEDMRADDEQKRKDTKTKDEIIRENNTKIADLERTNRIQLDHIEELERINEKIKKKKRDLVEEKEMMKKQIGELKAEEEELKLKLQVQIDPKELNQLKTQNGDLSSQIEELKRKVKSSESECKRLQEELKKSSKYRSPGVFFPTGNEFAGNCPGVICFLKKDASAKLRASRSSDGLGEASDILNHKKGAISGTAERENSWWSIDLGINYRLIITHYSLRQGKRHGESALTDWQLEGSHDGKNWKELKTIHNGKDPQFFAPPPFYTGTWSVGGEIPAFRFFRIFQTGRNSSGKYGIYLSGIELYGVLLNI